MELSSYFTLLRKYLYIVIIIVLATVIASYLLVKNLPDDYVSHGKIATGIVDASRHLLDRENPNVQADQITREFSNLTEILKLKKLIDQVSYHLIIHDLSSPTPFRRLNHQFKNLSPGAVDHALTVFKDKLQRSETLSLYNKDENGLNDLLISMGYDERSIRKNLEVARDEESDFITVSYTSDNPQLSAFVVNTLCSEFITYYTLNIKQNVSNAIDSLSKQLIAKRNALNEKKDSLQQYKIKNGILNLDEQSKALYGQILAYTDKKLEADRTIASYNGAIKNIDNRFDPKDRKYIEAAMGKYTTDVTETKDQLNILTDEYVKSGFNPKYKPALDSLQKQVLEELHLTSDKYLSDPRVGKDALVLQKMNLEVSRDLAQYSVKAINNAIAELNGKLSRLVPLDAIVKTYEFDIDIASKEYLDVLNKYNETNTQANFSIKLKQAEVATPDVAQPSKKIMLIALSGFISLILCLLVLFILFYLDDNIKEPGDLVNRTKLPLLGSLNLIPGPKPDLRKLWDVDQRNKMKHFKELLRSVRFEIDQELRGEKILAVTSLVEGEGKTLVTLSLAFAYSAINKKVLLIDGNFNHPTLSKTIQPKAFIEDHFRKSVYIERENNNAITLLGNQGGDISLLEINDEKHIQNELNELKSRFDIILIDLPALDSLNKSKEWMLFANKGIAVFEANNTISASQNQYIDYLRNLDNKFAGWVMNKAEISTKKSKGK